MEKNLRDYKGCKHGYWEEDNENVSFCGHYEHGDHIGVWRTYGDGILSDVYTRGSLRFWICVYSHKMIEHINHSFYVHTHHLE